LDLALTGTAGNFIDGDSITVGSVTLTFRDTPSVDTDVQIGADFDTSVASLMVKCLDEGITAAYGGAGNFYAFSVIKGVVGNSEAAIASLDAGGDWSDAGGFLVGGREATVGTLGQSCVVTHTDVTKTEWVCVDTINGWLPRTTGLLWDATNYQWIRLNRVDGALDYTILPNQ
jgi:hypothetical protein